MQSMNIGTFSERSHLVYRESVKKSTRYLSYKTELDVSSEGPSSGIVPNYSQFQTVPNYTSILCYAYLLSTTKTGYG